MEVFEIMLLDVKMRESRRKVKFSRVFGLR